MSMTLFIICSDLITKQYANIMAGAITTLLDKELTASLVITGKPINNDLTRLRETLVPILLSIFLKEDKHA